VIRHSVLKHAIAQQLDYMCAVQTPRHSNCQAFAAVLVDHDQQAQTASIVRPGFDEVVTPYMMAMLRPQSDAASVVQPQAPARLMSGGNFQAFPPPDALHPILADFPSSQLQHPRDSSIAEAAVLTGECQDRLRESILIVNLRGLITLGGAPLPRQPAGVPFAESFVPGVLNGEASPHGT
jgi:hypothetical protein